MTILMQAPAGTARGIGQSGIRYDVDANNQAQINNEDVTGFISLGWEIMGETLPGVELLVDKGAPNGYCPLDSNSLVPLANIPALSGYATAAQGALAASALQPGAAASNISGRPVIVGGFYPGVPAANAILLMFIATDACSFPSGLGTSKCKAGTAAATGSVITINKNGSAVGTATFAASGAVAAIAASAAFSLAAGDILTAVFPGTVDASLANVAMSLRGTFS
jgi:hypothetical protein